MLPILKDPRSIGRGHVLIEEGTVKRMHYNIG